MTPEHPKIFPGVYSLQMQNDIGTEPGNFPGNFEDALFVSREDC